MSGGSTPAAVINVDGEMLVQRIKEFKNSHPNIPSRQEAILDSIADSLGEIVGQLGQIVASLNDDSGRPVNPDQPVVRQRSDREPEPATVTETTVNYAADQFHRFVVAFASKVFAKCGDRYCRQNTSSSVVVVINRVRKARVVAAGAATVARAALQGVSPSRSEVPGGGTNGGVQ